MEIRYTTDFYCQGWFRNRAHFMRFISELAKSEQITRGVARKLRKWSACPKAGDIIAITNNEVTFENFLKN